MFIITHINNKSFLYGGKYLMLKAVFVDYTGTIIKNDGQDVREMVRRCYENSDIESPQAMLTYWWKRIKEFEEKSFGDTFLSEDEIVEEILQHCVKQIHLKDNLDELHELCRRFWIHAPVFEDTREFFSKCRLPIYIITNISTVYVEEGMKEKDLHPANIISSDMAKAHKPHRQLFEKALEISGCRAEEVIHIGDSITSDVKGASLCGIKALFLDRNKQKPIENIDTIHSLLEALKWIESF